jgi:hypothetical protein
MVRSSIIPAVLSILGTFCEHSFAFPHFFRDRLLGPAHLLADPFADLEYNLVLNYVSDYTQITTTFWADD